MVYVYQVLQSLVFRVNYESATSMILSTTLGERFMLPCSLLAYEAKLGKQTIAESSSEDTDDSDHEDEFRELSLGESEDDDEDERSPPKAPKGKTKKSNIRLGLQRGAVRWTAVTDEASFQAQAGSGYEEYVEPRALKASHAGASTSSMLSPIKETGERPEPGTAKKRGTRSAEKQALSMAEGHTPSTTGRHEQSIVERRGTRSAEKRAPSIVEERSLNTTERPESSTQEDTLSAATTRIASSKSAHA
eukprot:1787570-Pleurochrysis_carterae.AAC.1